MNKTLGAPEFTNVPRDPQQPRQASRQLEFRGTQRRGCRYYQREPLTSLHWSSGEPRHYLQ
jgi:hypothetical protein